MLIDRYYGVVAFWHCGLQPQYQNAKNAITPQHLFFE